MFEGWKQNRVYPQSKGWKDVSRMNGFNWFTICRRIRPRRGLLPDLALESDGYGRGFMGDRESSDKYNSIFLRVRLLFTSTKGIPLGQDPLEHTPPGAC
jgi:hypothetical protein